jgi:hypothetical protein
MAFIAAMLSSSNRTMSAIGRRSVKVVSGAGFIPS